MLIQSSTGPITGNASGATPNLRSGNQGDILVSELHGPYYEQTFRQKSFRAATAALVTTTVGLATTYTGLVVSNPIGSGVNLEILTASFMQSVLQSTQVEAYAIFTGFNATTQVTHTTPVSPTSNFVGSGATPAGLADVSATLPTAPLYALFVSNTPSATTNAAGQVIDLKGSIVLAPGGYIGWTTPTQASVATSLWFSFSWNEVPTTL